MGPRDKCGEPYSILSPSQLVPIPVAEGKEFSLQLLSPGPQLMETDKEGPANSKEIPEFEFGLVAQLSWAAG